MSPLPPSDPNEGPRILGVSWGTLSVATLVVSARVFARANNRSFGFDDACIIVSTLVSLFGAICNSMEVHYGFGRHMEDLTLTDLMSLQHWGLAAEMQAAISIAITKVSICWFILRLLGPTHRWIRVVIWVNIGCIAIVTTVYMFFQGFACVPLKKYWDPTVPGTCLSLTTIGHVALASDIIDVITDFLCAALPLSVVQALKMSRQTKTIIAVVIGLGFLTAATSIGKAITIQLTTSDQSWNLVKPTYWVVLEENAAIIVASLPGVGQFIRLFRSRFLEMRKSFATWHKGDTWPETRESNIRKEKPGLSQGVPTHAEHARDHMELHPLVSPAAAKVKYSRSMLSLS